MNDEIKKIKFKRFRKIKLKTFCLNSHKHTHTHNTRQDNTIWKWWNLLLLFHISATQLPRRCRLLIWNDFYSFILFFSIQTPQCSSRLSLPMLWVEVREYVFNKLYHFSSKCDVCTVITSNPPFATSCSLYTPCRKDHPGRSASASIGTETERTGRWGFSENKRWIEHFNLLHLLYYYTLLCFPFNLYDDHADDASAEWTDDGGRQWGRPIHNLSSAVVLSKYHSLLVEQVNYCKYIF